MADKRISALTEETELSSEYFFPIDGENGTRKYNLSSFQQQTVEKAVEQVPSNTTFIGSVMQRGVKFDTNPMVYLEDYFQFKTGHKYFVDVNFRNYLTTAQKPTVNGEYLSTSIDGKWTGLTSTGSAPLDFYYQFEYGKDSSALSVNNLTATTPVGIKCWDVTKGMKCEEPFKDRIEDYLFANHNANSIYAESHRIKGVFSNDYILSVGRLSFVNNQDLQGIDLKNCECVGRAAFQECSNLSAVSIPKCEHIDVKAFSECNINDAYLPQCSVLSDSVFLNCYSLSSIYIPNCTIIGYCSLNHCDSLSNIHIPNCTEIKGMGLAGCSSLISVYLPECQSIGEGGFSGCESLISAYLPKCTYLGPDAFIGCTSMESITLESCNEIGFRCFMNSGLSSIHLYGDNMITAQSFLEEDLFTDTPIGNLEGIIYVPKKLETAYKEDDFWSTYSSIISGV